MHLMLACTSIQYSLLFAHLFHFTFLIFSYSSLFLYLISLCGFLFFLFLFSCPHCSDLVHFCVKIPLFCLYLLSVFSLELCMVILFFPCVCLYFLVPAFGLIPQPLDFDAKQCSTVITAVNVLDWCLHSWAQYIFFKNGDIENGQLYPELQRFKNVLK